MGAAEDRALYEAAVRGLRAEADELFAQGHSPEAVAKTIVARRNALKRAFREGVDPLVLAAIEARNRARYGDPVGPTPVLLLERYGDWDAVIVAACRPADLSGDADGRKTSG